MHHRIKQLLFGSTPYILVLGIFCWINYIDLRTINKIYLPILLISAIEILFKKYYVGHIVLLTSEIGLVLDYIVHLSNGAKPNMFGGFLNTFVLAIGFIIGVVIQIIIDKKNHLS